MEILGQVKAILNKEHILITYSQKLDVGDILTVFDEIQSDKIKDSLGIKRTFFPKGELRVVCPQEQDIYLVERYREFTEKTTRITIPSPFQKQLLGFAAQIVPETKEVVERIPGPWSAEIDLDASLGVAFSKTVKVGDSVGRI